MREEDFWSELSCRLKMTRETAEITQKDLANKLGVSESAYRSYELGDRKIPVYLLAKLGAIYDVSIDKLIGNEKKSKEPAIVSGTYTNEQSEKIKNYAELVKKGML